VARFESGDAKSLSGTLVVVLPNSYDVPLDEGLRTWITSVDELGPPAPQLYDIRDLGRPAVEISMKTLYFLHHRDPPGAEHHESVEQIMEGDRPLARGRMTTSDHPIKENG